MDELSSFALLTNSLFIVLGAAIGAAPGGRNIYASLHRWPDRAPGGLVIANILACAYAKRRMMDSRASDLT
jgi:C4-dicarboxylate transporter, DctM subunit